MNKQQQLQAALARHIGQQTIELYAANVEREALRAEVEELQQALAPEDDKQADDKPAKPAKKEG